VGQHGDIEPPRVTARGATILAGVLSPDREDPGVAGATACRWEGEVRIVAASAGAGKRYSVRANGYAGSDTCRLGVL